LKQTADRLFGARITYGQSSAPDILRIQPATAIMMGHARVGMEDNIFVEKESCVRAMPTWSKK
jgi:uncharacterized protein (DUF849 family)